MQAEKLATAGRMTASIAHEINNPLQSVQNCLHLAARQDLPLDVREKYFEMTKSELERLMSTVQRMLDFYRPNAEREKVNLIDILDHVLLLLSTQLNNRGIKSDLSLAGEYPGSSCSPKPNSTSFYKFDSQRLRCVAGRRRNDDHCSRIRRRHRSRFSR